MLQLRLLRGNSFSEVSQALRTWKPNFVYVTLGLDAAGATGRLRPFRLVADEQKPADGAAANADGAAAAVADGGSAAADSAGAAATGAGAAADGPGAAANGADAAANGAGAALAPAHQGWPGPQHQATWCGTGSGTGGEVVCQSRRCAVAGLPLRARQGQQRAQRNVQVRRQTAASAASWTCWPRASWTLCSTTASCPRMLVSAGPGAGRCVRTTAPEARHSPAETTAGCGAVHKARAG